MRILMTATAAALLITGAATAQTTAPGQSGTMGGQSGTMGGPDRLDGSVDDRTGQPERSPEEGTPRRSTVDDARFEHDRPDDAERALVARSRRHGASTRNDADPELIGSSSAK
jgi:hypothetical protein